jgi:hypothetical protein
MASKVAAASPPKSLKGVILAALILAALVALGMLILNIYFLYYMDRLDKEGCKCALGWRRQFVEVCLVYMLATQVLGFLFMRSPLIQIINMFVFVAYVIVARQFISRVEATHCDCAEKPAFGVLRFINTIQLFILALAFVAVLFRLLTLGAAAPKK